MNTYYIVHDRGTKYRMFRGWSLAEAYIYSAYSLGKLHSPGRKNALPQAGLHVFDDMRDVERLFPKAKFSGLGETNGKLWSLAQ